MPRRRHYPLNKLYKTLSELEGRKQQQSIAQISETIGALGQFARLCDKTFAAGSSNVTSNDIFAAIKKYAGRRST